MKIDEKIFYSKEIEKEIRWILKNCTNIDQIIEEKKKLIISLMNNTVNAKLKSEAGYGNANSLEDVIIKIDENPQIKRLEKWKEVLEIAFILIETGGRPYITVIEEKYKNKNDNEKIMELLGINENTLFYLELDIRRSVYQIAIDFGLYKE